MFLSRDKDRTHTWYRPQLRLYTIYIVYTNVTEALYGFCKTSFSFLLLIKSTILFMYLNFVSNILINLLTYSSIIYNPDDSLLTVDDSVTAKVETSLLTPAIFMIAEKQS